MSTFEILTLLFIGAAVVCYIVILVVGQRKKVRSTAPLHTPRPAPSVDRSGNYPRTIPPSRPSPPTQATSQHPSTPVAPPSSAADDLLTFLVVHDAVAHHHEPYDSSGGGSDYGSGGGGESSCGGGGGGGD
jgi:hypothetical protein